MARPRKDAVDYFPHFVNWGKTIPILESKFGNDGYACWFKILETLGKTSGHALDCNDSMEWEFLVQKLRVSEDTATEIIAVLCKLGAIDATLWNEKRIIWSENFVAQLEPVYTKRRVSAPEKPECAGFCSENPEVPEVSAPEKRQRRVEESKEEERKEEKEATPPPATKAKPKDVQDVKAYCGEIGMPVTEAQKFMDHYDANGWVQGREKPIKDWKAAVRQWKSRLGEFSKNGQPKSLSDFIPR